MGKHVINASGKSLQSVCSRAVKLLVKKESNDVVVVINAAGLRAGAPQRNRKIYYKTSRDSDIIRSTNFGNMLDEHPENVVETAITGMLQNNRDGRLMLRRLKVYSGGER